jgi:hypothetical protein
MAVLEYMGEPVLTTLFDKEPLALPEEDTLGIADKEKTRESDSKPDRVAREVAESESEEHAVADIETLVLTTWLGLTADDSVGLGVAEKEVNELNVNVAEVLAQVLTIALWEEASVGETDKVKDEASVLDEDRVPVGDGEGERMGEMVTPVVGLVVADAEEDVETLPELVKSVEGLLFPDAEVLLVALSEGDALEVDAALALERTERDVDTDAVVVSEAAAEAVRDGKKEGVRDAGVETVAVWHADAVRPLRVLAVETVTVAQAETLLGLAVGQEEDDAESVELAEFEGEVASEEVPNNVGKAVKLVEDEEEALVEGVSDELAL